MSVPLKTVLCVFVLKETSSEHKCLSCSCVFYICKRILSFFPFDGLVSFI